MIATISESDRRRLIDEHHEARHAAFRWGALAESLIYAHNSLREAAGDRVFIRHDGAQLELLEAAIKALGPFVGKAVGFQRNAEEAMQAIDAQLDRPETPNPTPQEMKAIGARMATDPSQIESNLEGLAFLHHRDDERRREIERTGCCGGTPSADGVCFGIGQCPRFFEAQRCERFVADYLEWLEQINEQTALAAIAARLCVESPLIDSEVFNV